MSKGCLDLLCQIRESNDSKAVVAHLFSSIISGSFSSLVSFVEAYLLSSSLISRCSSPSMFCEVVDG